MARVEIGSAQKKLKVDPQQDSSGSLPGLNATVSLEGGTTDFPFVHLFGNESVYYSVTVNSTQITTLRITEEYVEECYERTVGEFNITDEIRYVASGSQQTYWERDGNVLHIYVAPQRGLELVRHVFTFYGAGSVEVIRTYGPYVMRHYIKFAACCLFLGYFYRNQNLTNRDLLKIFRYLSNETPLIYYKEDAFTTYPIDTRITRMDLPAIISWFYSTCHTLKEHRHLFKKGLLYGPISHRRVSTLLKYPGDGLLRTSDDGKSVVCDVLSPVGSIEEIDLPGLMSEDILDFVQNCESIINLIPRPTDIYRGNLKRKRTD